MNKTDSLAIEKVVQKILQEEKPKTVKKLIERTVELTSKDKYEVFLVVQELERTKRIHLGSPKIIRKLPETILEYFIKVNYFSVEFWTIFLLTAMFFPIIILIPEESSFLFLRVIFGFLFILFIPGWSITNLFFPKLYEVIDQFERFLIAIGVNVGIAIFSGLILNQVWIINSTPFTIIIGSFTFAASLLSSLLRIYIGSSRNKKLLVLFENIKLKIKRK